VCAGDTNSKCDDKFTGAGCSYIYQYKACNLESSLHTNLKEIKRD
jgi:hypothetical protein